MNVSHSAAPQYPYRLRKFPKGPFRNRCHNFRVKFCKTAYRSGNLRGDRAAIVPQP